MWLGRSDVLAFLHGRGFWIGERVYRCAPIYQRWYPSSSWIVCAKPVTAQINHWNYFQDADGGGPRLWFAWRMLGYIHLRGRSGITFIRMIETDGP